MSLYYIFYAESACDNSVLTLVVSVPTIILLIKNSHRVLPNTFLIKNASQSTMWVGAQRRNLPQNYCVDEDAIIPRGGIAPCVGTVRLLSGGKARQISLIAYR